MQFVRKYGLTIGQDGQCTWWSYTKFLLILISLIEELQIYQKKLTTCTVKTSNEMKTGNICITMGKGFQVTDALLEKFRESFQLILVSTYNLVAVTVFQVLFNSSLQYHDGWVITMSRNKKFKKKLQI